MPDIAQLGIVVRTQGVKESTQQLDALGKTSEKTAERAKQLGKALGNAAVIGIGIASVAMAKYVANTIEAERVQAQLNSRLRSTRGAAGLVIEDLNNMADSLQRLTVFDDESIGGVQALLLTFTKIGKDVFPRATEAVLDMSTALGTSLESAAVQVGKALNDPVQGITALGRAGVQFSDAQKKVIKDLVETGQQARAQGIILKELETQMGGAARAARDTLGGSLQALKNSFDNLLEGDSGSNGIRGARDAIEELNDTLNSPSVKQGFDGMVEGLARVAAEAIGAVSAVASFQQRMTDMFSVSKKVSSGAALSKFSDSELSLQQSNIANQMAKARKAGDADELTRLRAEFTRLQREDTRRIIGGAGAAKRDASTDRDLFIMEDKDRPKTSGGSSAAKVARDRTTATKELTAAEKAYNEVMETNAMIDEMVMGFRQDQVAVEYDRATALENSRKAIDGQIDDMRFELSLLGLTNQEREKEIALRYAGADATDEQKASIAALADETFRMRELTETLDDFKAGFADAFVDFASGAKGAKEAFGDFADSVYKRALQMIADKAINALFSSLAGGESGGQSSNAWADLFGFASDGFGFSDGGFTGNGGKLQPAGIVHRGEYVIDQENTRRLGVANLDRLNSGGGMAGGGVSQTNNFIIQGRIDQRTQSQIAQDMYRATSTASRRNS